MRDADVHVGAEYASEETAAADSFANMNYKPLMAQAEDGVLFGDEGGGEGVGADG